MPRNAHAYDVTVYPSAIEPAIGPVRCTRVNFVNNESFGQSLIEGMGDDILLVNVANASAVVVERTSD